MTSLSDSEEYRSQFLLPPNQKSMQEYKSIAFINSKEGSDLRIPEKATLGKVINHSTHNEEIAFPQPSTGFHVFQKSYFSFWHF